MRKLLLLIPALLLAVPLVWLLATARATDLQVAPAPVMGMETPLKIEARNSNGVRRLTVWIEQNGRRHKVHEMENPSRWFVFRGNAQPFSLTPAVGKKQAGALQDGPARLVVEAVSNDLLGRTSTSAQDTRINTQPLLVSADGHQHYINQAGAELVTFTVSGYWTEAGVRVGKYTFRSFPLPGKTANERFAFFAYPWDVPSDTAPVVYARNPTGTEATARFWHKIFPKKFRQRDLELNDAFLQKVVQDLNPSGSGSLVDKFLEINGKMRRENNQALADLRLKSEEKVLWRGPFFRIGKVESFFADQRSYIYQGKKIDEQMHLGFDLSDVQKAPVKSANSGRVILAAPLGIYGNCIVVDHGYGLQSIYGHLSEFLVKPGDMVQKEQVIARSGATGLAGGDHLHFSMQIDGVQINPLEWWDDHWIKDRILSKLPAQ